jgi:hypothetical protein
MRSIKPMARAVSGWLLAACCGAALAQAPVPTPAEVGARNAAAGFVVSSLATLGMLRDECEPLLGEGPQGAPAIARGWWDRNRPAIEAAYVWTDRYLQALRRSDGHKYLQVGRDLGTNTAEVVRRNAAGFFRQQLPTADSCRAALALFAKPELDLLQQGDNPGRESFAEFGRTLQRIRSEPGYTVPPHIRLDPERSLHFGLAASLQAAQAATRRGDAEAVRKAYAQMAQRGDAKAAYQLGAMHLRGDLVEQDDQQAYRWFHQAWLLRDPEGINALGVLHRDGRAGPANPKLALALFQLAAAQAADPQSRSRAQRNLNALGAKLGRADRHAVACMTLREIAEGVEQPLPPSARSSGQSTDPDQGRRLGDFLPGITGGIPIHCG